MENNTNSNFVDIYSAYRNHFQRWIDKYNRKSRELESNEEFENIKFDKYVSNIRNSTLMQQYQDEIDEYYNYIEKTLFELQTQIK